MPACGFEDRTQAPTPELQEAPAGMSSLTMQLNAPRKLRVVWRGEGGRDIEDIPAARRERELFGEGALAAPGAAED